MEYWIALGMKNKEFYSFKDAKSAAVFIAINFDVCVNIKVSGDKYVLYVPNAIRVANIRELTSRIYMFGLPNECELSALDYVDKSQFSLSNLAWRDPETGLAWDAARLVYSDAHTEYPAVPSGVMDALQYAGLRNWRLPTLDELKTLSINKLNSAGVRYGNIEGHVNFWSCEEIFSEKAFLDLVSMRVGCQHFIEQDRNWSTYGDGCTEMAQTIMVTSDQLPSPVE